MGKKLAIENPCAVELTEITFQLTKEDLLACRAPQKGMGLGFPVCKLKGWVWTASEFLWGQRVDVKLTDFDPESWNGLLILFNR